MRGARERHIGACRLKQSDLSTEVAGDGQRRGDGRHRPLADEAAHGAIVVVQQSRGVFVLVQARDVTLMLVAAFGVVIDSIVIACVVVTIVVAMADCCQRVLTTARSMMMIMEQAAERGGCHVGCQQCQRRAAIMAQSQHRSRPERLKSHRHHTLPAGEQSMEEVAGSRPQVGKDHV
jgi:hypothetical protein